MAYRKRGEHDRVIQGLDQAMRLDPKYPIAFAKRAEIYQIQGEHEWAARDYDEVIRLRLQAALADCDQRFACSRRRDRRPASVRWNGATLKKAPPGRGSVGGSRWVELVRRRATARRSIGSKTFSGAADVR